MIYKKNFLTRWCYWTLSESRTSERGRDEDSPGQAKIFFQSIKSRRAPPLRNSLPIIKKFFYNSLQDKNFPQERTPSLGRQPNSKIVKMFKQNVLFVLALIAYATAASNATNTTCHTGCNSTAVPTGGNATSSPTPPHHNGANALSASGAMALALAAIAGSAFAF